MTSSIVGLCEIQCSCLLWNLWLRWRRRYFSVFTVVVDEGFRALVLVALASSTVECLKVKE